MAAARSIPRRVSTEGRSRRTISERSGSRAVPPPRSPHSGASEGGFCTASLPWGDQRVGTCRLRLRSLELAGFKTFAVPTRIDFAEGITAIVGANGSGKSNIVDGLRWVLGEQSMRDLRGRRSEDVIFAGSSRRRPSGIAEVNLLLDNETRWLPVDGSEAQLSRRLFRSGDAEYLVNGYRVRLRDLIDVVRAAGLDAGGHLIVGQGLVDSVLSVKGAERRTYLAAVAGVAPYEARRAETASRLTQTRQNMSQAYLILEEIEPRLRLLRRQNSIAESALRARDVLHAALTREYALRWGLLTMELRQAASERDALDSDIVARRRDLEDLGVRAEAARAEAQAAQREREQARSRALEARYLLKSAEDALSMALETQARENDTMAALRSELAGVSVAPTEQAVDTAARRASELRSRLQDLQRRSAGLETIVNRLREQVIEREAALHEIRRRRVDAAASAHNFRVEGDRLQSRLKDSRSMHAEFSGLLVEFHARQQEADRVLESIEQDRTQAEAALAEAVTRYAALEEDLQRARSETREVERRHAETERTIEELTSRRIDLVASRPDTAGPTLVEFLSISPTLAAPVAALLADLSDSLLAEAPERAGARAVLPVPDEWRQEITAILRHAGIRIVGWMSDLVSLDEQASLFAGTLRSSLLLDEPDLDRCWQLVSELPGHKAGHPPLRLLNPEGFLREPGALHSPSPETGAAVRREAAIQSVAQELVAASAEAEAIELRLQAAHERHEATQRAEEQGRLRHAQAVANLRDHADREHAARREATAVQVEIESLTIRLSQLVESQTELEAAIREAGAAEERETRALQVISEEEAQADQGRSETAQELDRQTAAMRATQDDARLLERQSALEEEEIARLRQIVAVNRQTRDRLEARIAAAVGQAEEAQRRTAALEADIERLRLAVKDAERELAETPDLTQPPDDIAPRMDELHRSVEAAVAQRQRILSRIDQLEAEIETLESECLADLNCSPQTLPPPETEERLSDLDIRRLRIKAEQGEDVDPGVREELTALEQRRDSLQEQLADLEAAAEQLELLLREADREVRRRFRMTFLRVNDLFGRFFRQIFDGGDAELLLDSADEQESVEVIAQLPGKRSRDVNALSGGERTLVAGAFLFSLVAAAPPPFCVLDEVDAALDETNVDRYVGVLRELSADTQFVVVTHNRGTMAAANSLYGIVLDEEVGSRALSLRLDEAVAQA